MKFFTLCLLGLVSVINASNLDSFDVINYEIFAKSNFEIIKNNNLLLLLITEKNDETSLTILKNFKDELSQSGNVDIKVNLMLKDDNLAKRFNIQKYPQVLFFRFGRHVAFNGDVNVKSLVEWTENYQQKSSFDLNDASFEHDTQATSGATTGDCHKKSCDKVAKLESALEYAAAELKGQKNFAYVDYDENPRLKKRFSIGSDSPVMLFFRAGAMYKYNFNSFDTESFVGYTTKFFKNIKEEKIPREVTYFDVMVEDVVKYLKENNQIVESLAKNKIVLISLTSFALLIFVTIMSKLFKKNKVKAN